MQAKQAPSAKKTKETTALLIAVALVLVVVVTNFVVIAISIFFCTIATDAPIGAFALPFLHPCAWHSRHLFAHDSALRTRYAPAAEAVLLCRQRGVPAAWAALALKHLALTERTGVVIGLILVIVRILCPLHCAVLANLVDRGQMCENMGGGGAAVAAAVATVASCCVGSAMKAPVLPVRPLGNVYPLRNRMRMQQASSAVLASCTSLALSPDVCRIILRTHLLVAGGAILAQCCARTADILTDGAEDAASRASFWLHLPGP